MYTYIYIYIHIYPTYIHTYTHTHIHTYIYIHTYTLLVLTRKRVKRAKRRRQHVCAWRSGNSCSPVPTGRSRLRRCVCAGAQHEPHRQQRLPASSMSI